MSKKSAELSRSERAAAAIAAQRTQERRRNLLVVGGVVALVVAVLAGAYVFSSSSDTSGETASDVPAGVEDYSVVVGEESAPSTITVYEDPQCPICRDFEAAVGEQVATAVEAGDVKVDYRIVSFLDRASGNEYSSRAANALMAVQDVAGPDAFAALHETLFANQPEEGSDGPDDEQLVAWAVEAGAEESEVRPLIEGKVFEQFVVNATDQMSQDGVTGTPTVLIDGQPAGENPAEYAAAVLDVVSGD